MQSIRLVVLRDAWQDFQFVERSGQLSSPFVFAEGLFVSPLVIRGWKTSPEKDAATTAASRSLAGIKNRSRFLSTPN